MDTADLLVHGYKPSWLVSKVATTKCETVKFDMTKNKTLTAVELSIHATAKTVDGIIWKWNDGTVTSSPSTLRATNTVKLTLEANNVFMGFMTDESSGPAGSGIKLINALSLIVLDTVCLAK